MEGSTFLPGPPAVPRYVLRTAAEPEVSVVEVTDLIFQALDRFPDAKAAVMEFVEEALERGGPP